MSARSVQQCIKEIVENVSMQQTARLKNAVALSIALDENMDMNDIACLAVMARSCDLTGREMLCCLKSMSDTDKDRKVTSSKILIHIQYILST